MSLGNISVLVAFLAGLASFLSPCVFSLVPAYVGYLSGRTVASAGSAEPNRWTTLSHGFAFVFGFSAVFILLGVATSAVSQFFYAFIYDLTFWIGRIGGILVIIFGIHLTGLYRIRWLEYDLRPQTTPDRRKGYAASAMMGVFFSAGWSPCVGPILGAILTIVASGGSVLTGVQLLSAYSVGLAIPFLLASTQIGLVTKVIRRYGKVMHYVEVAMGVLLIVVGVLLATGRFQTLANVGLDSLFGPIDEVLVGQYLLIGALLLAVIGLLPAYIASQKGRNFLDWWFFGAGLFPVALVASLLIKSESAEDTSGDTKPGSVYSGS